MNCERVGSYLIEMSENLKQLKAGDRVTYTHCTQSNTSIRFTVRHCTVIGQIRFLVKVKYRGKEIILPRHALRFESEQNELTEHIMSFGKRVVSVKEGV